MSVRRALVAVACVVGSTLAAAAPSAAECGPREQIGRSTDGRALVVYALEDPAAARRVLVVGCIHGTECAGVAIVRALRASCSKYGPARWPPGGGVWVVPDLNPDGHRRSTRVNARGVDLNRNFAGGWRPIGTSGDPQYAGPRPFSEPESRAARHLIELVRPSVTIWYHQGQGPLARAWGASVPAARRYARRARLPFRRLAWLAGTAPHWQNVAFPGTSSFVVELPDGELSARDVHRHAAAVTALARHRDGPPPEMRGSAELWFD